MAPKKSKAPLVIGIVAGVLALLLIAGAAVYFLLPGRLLPGGGGQEQADGGGQGGGIEQDGAGAPAGDGTSADGMQVMQPDGSVVYGAEHTGLPVVEVYMDFQCPACEQFHAQNGAQLKKLAEDGEITLHYRPVSIFAGQPDPIGPNSVRAGVAAMAAAEAGRFVEYQELLFDNQPAEGDEGFSPEELKEWGAEAGIDDPAFAERIDAEMPAAQAAGVERSAPDGSLAAGLLGATDAVTARYSGADAFSGTPSIYLNGKLVGGADFQKELEDALEDAGPGKIDV
ncbi:DsbA family protein [Nocardiopsis composta]|uniref:Protein-disulfide isomerase n=1 Tax=Nocardiopsis composta TaxID=157465 RepID=A0A7W8QHV2_9ACTN|nr:thioredoxin domain-containing protein [Nocardiopsis composta]MBB5430005.1 protein-disulfide isomerase [Nocardiopsis composta]